MKRNKETGIFELDNNEEKFEGMKSMQDILKAL